MLLRALAGLSTLALAILVTVTPATAASNSVATADLSIPVRAEPDGTKVKLDATVYRPSGGRYPAVILAHGFGGSKADLAGQAHDLAARGYVVLAFSARGFGRSNGRIHLLDPAYEIDDVKRLVGTLASDSAVELDRPGDPKVAIVGGSYGGAQALMAAALDKRIDTNVSLITWNDLSAAFFPQAARSSVNEPGPFKQLWGSRFFAGALLPGARVDPLCGRFDPAICRQFRTAVETGQSTSSLLELLRAHSPAPYLKTLRTPTLLIQGEADSLFGLDQAEATARTLATQGTQVAVRWTAGGHDGTSDADAALERKLVLRWLAAHLPSPANPPETAVDTFSFALPDGSRSIGTLPGYPGIRDEAALERQRIAMKDIAGHVLNPPGGKPSSITSVPGADTSGLSTYDFAALPGQSVAFDTGQLDRNRVIAGSPQTTIRVTSTSNQVTLFASLWRLDPGGATQPRPLVAPLRVAVEPGQPKDITINLPMNTYRMLAGSTWRVLISSTDSAFASPDAARIDQVTLADPFLTVPVLPESVAPTAPLLDREAWLLLGAIGAMALLILGYARWNRVRHPHPTRTDLADVPLAVSNLVKVYPDGHRAVDDVSWRADRGQVIGLLGPNGAGKTTTIRMLLGLIRPDSGTVHVLGQPVHPGAPVLSRVGALVEGPGFLPHLTGRANLLAYWQATGRPVAEAGFDDALEVAALGDALDRPVRTYSHGMRQRLGIAQAMLGRPELLFLDEPTNGLDPPQIAAMRPILKAYAAAGRTVVVSSHLLGEVEQTCTHVVVMHAGRVVTAGRVEDLVSSDDTTVLGLASPDGIGDGAAALRRRGGILDVEAEIEPPRLVVTARLTRAEVVRLAVAEGLPVVDVGARRHLEEVFLGVIAQAQGATAEGGDAGAGGKPASLNDRLRQVRSR